MLILSTITATDIAAWSSAISIVVGAISVAVVKIINARRDAVIEIEKQRIANENSQKIAKLEAGHDGNIQAINNLAAAVTSHDAQLTTVALTTTPQQDQTKF